MGRNRIVRRGGALVCFPYAGGNAVNFLPMARALRDSGLAVYAVELPGHDVAAGSEAFAPMERVVDQVVAEIAARDLKEVLLWGHSSGTAFAVETARRLERAGTTVQRVFLGAQLIGAAADRRAAVTEIGGRSNAEISALPERRQRLHRARRAGRRTRRACRCRVPQRLHVGEPVSCRGP